MFQENKYLNTQKPIDKGARALPHWQQGGVAIFVTWRTFGSLPTKIFRLLEWERNCWLRAHPKPWTKTESTEFDKQFSKKMDHWLDQSKGNCPLRNTPLAKIVADAILFFDGVHFDITSFVVMPNHVHVLFRPRRKGALPKIIKSWKNFSAHRINKIQKRNGPFWQEGYWDRLIRSPTHFFWCFEYIRRNPLKAGLSEGEFFYFQADKP